MNHVHIFTINELVLNKCTKASVFSSPHIITENVEVHALMLYVYFLSFTSVGSVTHLYI